MTAASPIHVRCSGWIRRLTHSAHSWFFAILSAASIAPAAPAKDPATALALAGWAEIEITPPLGIGLGGRGGPDTAATKILDPLFAQVTVLKDSNGVGLVLISLDVVGLSRDLSDQIRTDLVDQLGMQWNLILLNASHTHSGPYMIRSLIAGLPPAPPIETEYLASLREKIRTATQAAAKALQPVRVEVFEATSRVAINRRGKNKQGRRAMLPDPDGPYDSKLWVLRLTPAGGSAPAILFSYACHPVIVYGYAYSAISADFPGVARRRLREQLGDTTHIQFIQGFAGDVRPRVVADLENHRFRTPKPEDLQRAGQDLASAVQDALSSAGRSLALHLAGTADRPFLPRDKPPPREFYEKLRSDAVARTNKFLVSVSDYWLKRYDQQEGFSRGDAWSLGLIRLSEDQWIVHSGGEPCVGWREKISQWLKPLNIVTFGYTQEAKSYLPTEAMLPEGGYEVLESNQARASTPAPFAPGIEKAARESLLRQLAFLRAQTK